MNYHSEIRRHITPVEFSSEQLEWRWFGADLPNPAGEEPETEARHSQWLQAEPLITTPSHDPVQSPESYFLCHPDQRLGEAWPRELLPQRGRSCLRC